MTDNEYVAMDEAISDAPDKKTLEKLAAILQKLPNDTDKQDLMRNLMSKLAMY